MKNLDPPKEPPEDEHDEVGLKRFIESMGAYFEKEGVPRIGGRILGLLLASQGPVSAEQMASRLKVSRASISTNIRMLTASGLVEKLAFLDHRHTFYEITGDVWGRAITAGREKVLAFKSIASMGLSILSPSDPASRRLEEMIEWSDMMSEVYDKVLIEWQERRARSEASHLKEG